MAYLKIIAGLNGGHLRQLREPKSVLGRHPDCDISIDNLDTSRHHCQIVCADNEYSLEDLHSRNGTFLNDDRLRGAQKLMEGDRIRISEVVFEFHQGDSYDPARTELLGQKRQVSVLVGQPSDLVVVSQRDATDSHSAGRSQSSLQAQMEALLAVAQSLRNSLSLNEVLPHILDSLFAVYRTADRGLVALQNANGELVPRWVQLRAGETDKQVVISRTIAKQAMELRQAILSTDAIGDIRFKNSSSLGASPIRSVMCAPLIDNQGKSFGVLQIDTFMERGCFREEDLEVLVGIATQVSVAIDNAQLHEMALQQRAVDRDLELAGRIQRSFLPASPPQVPGYEFFHYYKPASRVGGEFYDYVALPDGRITVVVAHVAAEGFAAALITARLAAEIRYCFLAASRPAEAVKRLNAGLVGELGENHSVTLVLAELTPGTGEVIIVNAGHLEPVLRVCDGRISEIGKERSEPLLGIVSGADYHEHALQIPTGGLLMMYTGGIVKAMNEASQVYGDRRLQEHLETIRGSARKVGQRIVDDLQQFTEGCPQRDDISLVCFGRE